jgi:hypothetical protein
LGEHRLQAFLKRHSYTDRKPARELLARLRNGTAGRAGELETEARREIVPALVTALEPIVARISELNIEIGRRSISTLTGERSARCSSLKTRGCAPQRCARRSATAASATPPTAPSPPTPAKHPSRSSPASPNSPSPLGLRPPPPRRV